MSLDNIKFMFASFFEGGLSGFQDTYVLPEKNPVADSIRNDLNLISLLALFNYLAASLTQIPSA